MLRKTPINMINLYFFLQYNVYLSYILGKTRFVRENNRGIYCRMVTECRRLYLVRHDSMEGK